MAIRAFFRRLFSSEPIRRALVASFIVMLFLGGVQLRRWAGEKTRHVRFQHDIVNGFYWGSETLAEARKLSPDSSSAESWPAFFRGYLALYDRVKDDAYEDDYGLDYPPLRLLAMSVWAKQVRSEFPGVDSGMARPLKMQCRGWQVQSGGMPTLPGTSNRSRFLVIRRYVFQNLHLTFYFAHCRAGRCGFFEL